MESARPFDKLRANGICVRYIKRSARTRYPGYHRHMSNIDPALECEYNNRALVPEHPAIFERWRTASAAFRGQADATLDLVYGDAPRHRLDLFHAADPRGTVVFIHGGYWRSLDKADFSFLAAPFVGAGLSVAMFNYRLCPQVGIPDVVADCRQAFTWLLSHGAQYGMPLDRIALTGHSAGGHLVAMLLATDWPDADSRRIVGGVALSGVFELEPLLRCSMNADLQLDLVTARGMSPVLLVARVPVPLFLAVGADESNAFRQQSHSLRAAWPDSTAAIEEVTGCNHFTIVDHFAQRDSASQRFVLQLFN
jgi:arylformamidase